MKRVSKMDLKIRRLDIQKFMNWLCNLVHRHSLRTSNNKLLLLWPLTPIISSLPQCRSAGVQAQREVDLWPHRQAVQPAVRLPLSWPPLHHRRRLQLPHCLGCRAQLPAQGQGETSIFEHLFLLAHWCQFCIFYPGSKKSYFYSYVSNIFPQGLVIRHLLWQQLLLRWYLGQQRVRVRVMIGF